MKTALVTLMISSMAFLGACSSQEVASEPVVSQDLAAPSDWGTWTSPVSPTIDPVERGPASVTEESTTSQRRADTPITATTESNVTPPSAPVYTPLAGSTSTVTSSTTEVQREGWAPWAIFLFGFVVGGAVAYGATRWSMTDPTTANRPLNRPAYPRT